MFDLYSLNEINSISSLYLLISQLIMCHFSKMEDNYILHSDCISNFEIASYNVYFLILSSTKYLSRMIANISNFTFPENIKLTRASFDKLHTFRNLTRLYCPRFDSVYQHHRFSGYIANYTNKFNINPILKSLTIHGWESDRDIYSFTNLIKLKMPNTSIPTVNYFPKLKNLELRMNEYETFSECKYTSNLKILHVYVDYDDDDFISTTSILPFKQHEWINLQKLKITIHYLLDNLNISFPNLTSLSIEVNGDNFYIIDWKTQTKLMRLCLKNINVKDINNYLVKAVNLVKLHLTVSDNFENENIKISHEYNSKLKYLKLKRFGKVELINMTQLKMNDISLVGKVRIRND